jgi:hypothetical protein
MRQQVVLPETPEQRRQLAGLAADLDESPLVGRPLPSRLRNFRPSAEGYLTSLGGPLAYMTRLREIERSMDEHEGALREAYEELAASQGGDAEAFDSRWSEIAAAWDFGDVNGLIDSHNRWYPVEARLRMDPTTRDFALVNGRSYRLATLDAGWVLDRFPASRDQAA